MYYISRIISKKNKYYVYDTSDNSEECLTYYEIRDAVVSGLHIEGVTYIPSRVEIQINSANKKYRKTVPEVLRIEVYKVPDGASLKASILNDIDIQINKDGIITYLSFNKSYSELRVCDFSVGLGDFCMSSHAYMSNNILVLDDRLKYVSKNTFSGLRGLKVDVTSMNSPEKIYQYCLQRGNDIRIIDKSERYDLIVSRMYFSKSLNNFILTTIKLLPKSVDDWIVSTMKPNIMAELSIVPDCKDVTFDYDFFLKRLRRAYDLYVIESSYNVAPVNMFGYNRRNVELAVAYNYLNGSDEEIRDVPIIIYEKIIKYCEEA